MTRDFTMHTSYLHELGHWLEDRIEGTVLEAWRRCKRVNPDTFLSHVAWAAYTVHMM